jgi:hypothetical protein
VSTSGKVFFGKESAKASEGKPVEKSSGEKPSEQPQPKPKPKIVRFHCVYCGRDGHKDEFCFKRKREERIINECSLGKRVKRQVRRNWVRNLVRRNQLRSRVERNQMNNPNPSLNLSP